MNGNGAKLIDWYGNPIKRGGRALSTQIKEIDGKSSTRLIMQELGQDHFNSDSVMDSNNAGSPLINKKSPDENVISDKNVLVNLDQTEPTQMVGSNVTMAPSVASTLTC